MRSLSSRLLDSTLALAAAGFLLLATNIAVGANPPGFPPFAKGEFTPADLGPKEPDLLIDFPGAAANRGIAKGSAVVNVLVDSDGKATDYLVIGCTDLSFGRKLLDQAKGISFQAAKFKGVAVPSRYRLGYTFNSKSAAINPMEAARNRMEETTGVKLVYSAVAEKDIDGNLEFLNVALPELPEGYPVTGKDPIKVFVTFYIDEDGHARVPNVESAAAPELIPGAIAAVRQWSFKPVKAKGKPALVFTGRPVRFMPHVAAVPPAGGAAK